MALNHGRKTYAKHRDNCVVPSYRSGIMAWEQEDLRGVSDIRLANDNFDAIP